MAESHPIHRRDFFSDLSFAAGLGGLAAVSMPHPAQAQETNRQPKGRRKPYVFVTLEGPDDGGDFGPRTPGTKTGGIQEALNYAHANYRDVYIFGGHGGLHNGQGVADNVYFVHEPIRVPWGQDFRLDGGNYVLHYTPKSGHAIHFDSQMNCRYKFGLIISQAKDATVCFRPETAGPDDFVVITASIFDFSAVLAEDPQGTSILLDSTNGPIVNCQLHAEECNSRGIGLHLSDAGGKGNWISNNRLNVMYGNQYHARDECTGLRLGEPGTRKIVHNSLAMSLHAPRGAYFDPVKKAYVTVDHYVPERAIGADIFAQSNVLTLSFFGPRAPGHDIVFEPDSRDNTVFAFNLPNGITNNARMPTNRIVPNWPVGFDVFTPPVPPSNEAVVNTNPYTVQILVLTAGEVSDWTVTTVEQMRGVPHNLSLVDNLKRPPRPISAPETARSQTISAALTPGQTIILEPGERIKVTYSKAPTWIWKALA